LQTAQLHRAYWSYEHNLGIAKIHYEPLGVFAIFFENKTPQINVNFMDKSECTYYRQQYKKAGVTLALGVIVGVDTEVTRVIERDNVFTFPEINLEVKLENCCRYFRPVGGEWTAFEDDVFVEYQPCNSLIDVK
jgi:hypothetical protein